MGRASSAELPPGEGNEADDSGDALRSGPRSTAGDLVGFSLQPTATFVIDDRYEVIGTLGQGGTATVHLARDLEFGRLVVVKVMKPEIAASPELKERFLFEAHALCRVDHPSVVTILDISDKGGKERSEGLPYLVLEALPGESLGDFLKRREAMPVAQALSLLRQAAVALREVHLAGLVHRDIKPDNVYLVGPIDQPTHVKVLDFGMAHVVEEGHDDESTSILGTAQYMAPEQILVEPIDARTDIYGLGVLLFRTITGHLPFDDVKNKHHLLRHQLFSPVPPASWLKDDIPVELERLIHRATRKDPDARYRNMDEVVCAFDRAIDALNHPEVSSATTIDRVVTESDVAPRSGPSDFEDDVYLPRTEKGRRAAQVLAVEFGIFARPRRSLIVPEPCSAPNNREG